jgi:hypothetical protein
MPAAHPRRSIVSSQPDGYFSLGVMAHALPRSWTLLVAKIGLPGAGLAGPRSRQVSDWHIHDGERQVKAAHGRSRFLPSLNDQFGIGSARHIYAGDGVHPISESFRINPTHARRRCRFISFT